jgi:hypothetical protein
MRHAGARDGTFGVLRGSYNRRMALCGRRTPARRIADTALRGTQGCVLESL